MNKIYKEVLATISKTYLYVCIFFCCSQLTILKIGNRKPNMPAKANWIASLARLSFIIIFSLFGSLIQAQVTISPATGGTGISADKAANATVPSFTALSDIQIQESAAGDDFATNVTELVLNAPAGWEFNTSGVTVNATGGDITIGAVTYTTTSITIPLTVASVGNIDLITISNLAVRAIDGASLPNSGDITPTFTGSINGLTTSSGLGALSQVVGNASKLVFTSQPGTATYGSVIGASTLATTDQFNNSSSVGLAANVIVTTTIASGTGTLSGTTTQNIGTSGGDGTVSFSNLFTSTAGAKTISVSAPGLTSAISNSFTIDQAPLTITANDQVKTYSTTLALGTSAFTTTGLVNGETTGSVTLTSAGAINTANVGSYPIVPSAATGGTFTASNYTITYTSGTLVVTQASTTISVTSNNNPSCSGSPVILTATITPNLATGTVEFFKGATSLGTATISGGVAILYDFFSISWS